MTRKDTHAAGTSTRCCSSLLTPRILMILASFLVITLNAQEQRQQQQPSSLSSSSPVLQPTVQPSMELLTAEPTDQFQEPSEGSRKYTEINNIGAVSCKNFQLQSGHIIDVATGNDCRDACSDQFGEDFATFFGFDHGESYTYAQYDIYYDLDDRTVLTQKGLIGLQAECYCQSREMYGLYEDPVYLCGKTSFGPIWTPQEPMPHCIDEGIKSSYSCRLACNDMFPVAAEKYTADQWGQWDGEEWHKYQEDVGCHCVLGATVDDVQICHYSSDSSYLYGDDSNNADGMSAGAMVAVMIAFVAFFCVLAISRKGDDDDGPDPDLLAFRTQQQQQQQQQSTAQELTLSVEERRKLRQDMVKSHLFCFRIDDGDAALNIESIIAEQQKEESANNTDNSIKGGTTFIVDTLRSAVTSVRTIGSGGCASAGKSECSICLAAYESNDTISWAREEECNHIYHQDCIVEWLMEHDNCPLCRTKLIVEDEDEDEDEDEEAASASDEA